MIKRGRWSSSISVDVDLDDVFIAMDERDRENMADWLHDEGYLDKYLEKERAKNLASYSTGHSWKEICNKLFLNQLRLTNEEEEIIKKITDRL
jgi:hypothetical protein